MQDYIQQFISLVDGPKLATLLILFLVDFLGGVVVAIKEGTFSLDKLANFINTTVFYYTAGYYLLGIAVLAQPSWQIILPVAFGLIVASLTASVIIKLKKLGIPIPDSIYKVLGGK